MFRFRAAEGEIFLLYTTAVFGYNKVSVYAKEAGTG